MCESVNNCGHRLPHGPAARRIEDEADVRDMIELLRLNYDRAVARHGLPAEASRA
jgi:hypothetical protein